MKCFKSVFVKKNLKDNFGFVFILFIVLLYFICLIIFVTQSYSKLKSDIRNIHFSLNNKKEKKPIKQYNLKQNLIQLDIIKASQLNKIYSKHLFNKYKVNPKNKVIYETGQNKGSINSEKILEYKDFELNSMNYLEAKKYDKRSFINYYISLLKLNHLFMFAFVTENDYNSRIIKIFLFFFFFTVILVINALFFNDDTMHKIYTDEGNYNFIYQIPIILYSTIISGIIHFLIKFLALSQSDIIEFKQEKNKINLDERYKKLLEKLRIKFMMFFVISFLFVIFFWYYISCFCGIYVNTESHLIKDSFISFLTAMIYPFGIYLIPAILRYLALRFKNPWIYKFAKILQMI